MARTVCTYLLVLLVVAPAAQGQDAQQLVRRHQYGAAIEAIRGAGGAFEGLPPQQLGVLGVAHLQRGYLLRDLAALQVDLGVRYYQWRDTSRSATDSRWTPYFLGRYHVAQANCDAAEKAFRTVLKDRALPGEYHDRARIWQAACAALQGRRDEARTTWTAIAPGDDAAVAGELAFARWWATGEDHPVRCGSDGGKTTAATRCRLWSAVRDGDAEAAYPHQRYLLHKGWPDLEQLVGGTFTLRFYDPATLTMLAAADFVAAAEAFRRLGTEQGTLYAGIGAYEAGHEDHARRFLAEASRPLADVYRAALDYREGRPADAEVRWQRARRTDADASIAWASVASHLEGQESATRQFARSFVRTPPSNRNDARTLGQVLLRAGAPDAARTLLERAYPAEYDNQLSVIEPGFLATLAHARFLGGRPFYPMVRSHLATLAQAFPVAMSALDLAQGLTAPERAVSLQKRTD